MSDYGLPAIYVLFAWWFSTGLILFLDSLPERTFRWSMLGATGLLAVALYGLVRSAADASVGGAYMAFACGLTVWGWNEISFLMGFVTGPRRTACPPGCVGWRRFGYATATIIHHEVAILASAAMMVALTWDAPNQIGVWTFLILWWMRLSTKLNIFLGVPNVTESFLPERLQHLKSFFAKKPMNLLFPVSITVSTLAAAMLGHAAWTAGAGAFEATGYALLTALLALAILEHWFLVLPLPVEALWRAPKLRASAAPLDDTLPPSPRAGFLNPFDHRRRA